MADGAQQWLERLGAIAAPLLECSSMSRGVANNRDGRFQLFFIGSDGALWTMPQSSPSNGWSRCVFSTEHRLHRQ